MQNRSGNVSPYQQMQKRVHFSPSKNDKSLNERELVNISNTSGNFGMQRTAAQTMDQNRATRQTNSISPADWSKYELNKSANLNQNQKSMKLPDKLQKLRERVKRDRSANVVRDQSREDSLYGRKKLAGDIDKECQRLRESYGQRRKNSNSSISGFTPELLQKQNFKEDPFDDRDASFYAQRSRASASFDRHMGIPESMRASDKENGMFQNRLMAQSIDPSVNQSGQNQINKYKRTQQKSLQTLASYQQKYERLEKNFKKFSNNIKQANQSEQIIEDLKFRTAVTLIAQSAKKRHYLELRAGFRQWRVCSGVALKSYENQEKLMIMAKCCQKMQSRLRNFAKIKFYQKWKSMTFSTGSAASGQQSFSKERIASILSDLITNSENFNRCIESDKYLSLILSTKLQDIFQNHILANDLLFFSNDTQETLGEEPTQADLKVFHDLSGEQIDYSNGQLVGQSILGRVLIGHEPVFNNEWHPIQIVESIQMDQDYNQEVDSPINMERLMELNQNQTNAFNKVKGLGSVFITFQAPLRLGILRLFFESNRSMSQISNQNSASKHLKHSMRSVGNGNHISLTSFQVRMIKNLTEVLPQFVQRIFEVRTQINSLAINSMDQQEQMREMENINCINQKVREFQRRIIDVYEQETLLQTVREEVERALSDGGGGFDLEGITLKQIVKSQRDQPGSKDQHLIKSDLPEKDLVRFYDHTQEDEEILEDFLDHKKDYYIHQISICPKIPTMNNSSMSVGTSQTLPSFGCFTFILQIQNKYPSQVNKNQASLALSPGSKMLSHTLHDQSAISAQMNPLNSFIGGTINLGQSLPKRQNLDSILKHRLSLFFRSIVPVLLQSLKISTQLLPKVERLEEAVKVEQQRARIVEWISDFSSSKGLIQQLDQCILHLELKEGLRQMIQKLQLAQKDQYQTICFVVDQSMISRPQFRQSHWQFCGFMDEQECQIFNQLVIQKYSDLFGAKKANNACQITQNQQNDGLFEINLQVEILPRDQQQVEEFQLLPLVNPNASHLIGHLIILCEDNTGHQPQNDSNLSAKLKILQEVFSHFLLDLSHKRQTYQALQEQHNKLLQQLEGEQITQEAKDLISTKLVIPYSRKPTLKTLGECIDNLSDKLVQNSSQHSVASAEFNNPNHATDFGQEINQIAYFKQGSIYIEDVRLYNTYTQFRQQVQQNGKIQAIEPNVPDEMLLQSFVQQQQIVYEDEVLEKVVMLYPLVTVSNLSQTVDGFQYQMNQSIASHHGLVLRFVLDRDNEVQKKLQNINIQLINVIQPVILAILQGGVMMKERLALIKVSQMIDKQRFGHFQSLLSSLRDLKSKNVYNFTRSNLYAKLAKSKRYMELKQQLNQDLDDVKDLRNSTNAEFFDMQEKRMTENQQIQFLIRQALKVMNTQAYKFKQSCFRRFVIGTRQDVYAKMSKKKKKATCAIGTMYSYFRMRSLFNKFAINTKTFRFIRNPQAKRVGAALCIFRNFRVVRERLGFLKLKKHMNMQLRASMTSCQETDKDLFIQLNQILLSSFQQEGGLDGGLSYAFGEVFNYIKTQTNKELYIKDIGCNIADDSFAGHIDEVIISIKSGIFQSGGGQTGNILNVGATGQKSRIFICRFDKNSHKLNVTSVLRINNQDTQMTYQKQLLNQIENNNAHTANDSHFDNCDDSEQVGEGQSYGQPFQKYMINSKRDLINLMLTKSNGIIFNFQNIQQSLSDIFLSQQSRHKDQNIGNRFQTVKRSKSALIIPMFDVSQQQIIGSFELYRYHQQIFSTDMEARFEYFSKRLGDFILLYGQLKAQQYQIEQLRLQMQKSIRPVGNLSALLKNVYLNAPNNHFPGAAHVLPIIIMNAVKMVKNEGMTDRSMSQNSNYQDLLSDGGQIGAHMRTPQDLDHCYYTMQKLAFFYQFKDNHIYNFDYDGTFIDEMMENRCILEMCPKNSMNPDEGPNNQPLGQRGNNQPFAGIDNNFDLQSSTMSLLSTGLQPGRQSQRMEGNSVEKVQSVTNESFKHIVYYPIFDIHEQTNIVAIFEVGYKKFDKKSGGVGSLTNETQHYLDQFRSHLDQFQVRLASFCKSIENLNTRKAEKKRARSFQAWKNAMIMAQCKEQYLTSQQQTLRNQEQCYSEYMSNLDNINTQLQAANHEKESLHKQIDQYSVEKRAKLKFLATSLVSSQNLFHKLQKQKIQQAFTKWQYNVSIRKIAEAAFTRVLQINHRHSRARIRTGVFLLKSLIDDRGVTTGFQNILQAAHMGRHNNRGERFGYGPGIDYNSADCAPLRKSMTRTSCQGNDTHILHNITSLLSPQNMKKIEQKNLYQKHINSFYLPQQQVNNSAMTIGRQMNFTTANDGQSLPLIQLKPQEVIKDLGSTNFASTQEKSRFTGRATDLKILPSSVSNLEFLNRDNRVISRYSNKSFAPQGSKAVDENLNKSQIELSRGKRDYSPILTTSKYDIKSLYDPFNGARTRHSASSVQRNLHYNKNDKRRSHRQTQSQTAYLKRHGGSLVIASSNKRLGGKTQLNMTKCELQKQLFIKQKQLTLLRKQMVDNVTTQAKKKEARNPRFVSNNQRSKSNHSAEDLVRNSVKGSLQRDVRTTVAADTALSKFDDNSFEKYAKINGRDVSPPVRLAKND